MKDNFNVQLVENEFRLFDKKKRIIYTNNRGFERKYKYIGNRYIETTDSDGDKLIYKFNFKHKLIYHKDTYKNVEFWFKYDKKDRVTYYKQKTKDNIDFEIISKYEKEYEIDEYINPEHVIVKYDNKQRKIYFKKDDCEEFWEYNNFDKITRYYNNKGDEYIANYNEYGMLVNISGTGKYNNGGD